MTDLSETDISRINAVIQEREGITTASGPEQAYFYAAGKRYGYASLGVLHYDNPSDAVEAYLKSLKKYLGDFPENSLVVWRAKPSLVHDDNGGVSVYSRLTVI